MRDDTELDGNVLTVHFNRQPQALSLQRALMFLADVMQTLVSKEAGYGDIAKHVGTFAPDVTPEMRIRTRLDEKLTRLRNLGTAPDAQEDTLRDIVGYIALLRGLQEEVRIEDAVDFIVDEGVGEDVADGVFVGGAKPNVPARPAEQGPSVKQEAEQEAQAPLRMNQIQKQFKPRVWELITTIENSAKQYCAVVRDFLHENGFLVIRFCEDKTNNIISLRHSCSVEEAESIAKAFGKPIDIVRPAAWAKNGVPLGSGR